ncbi:MAG: hypothetical protein KAH13_05605 [Tenericutes bacterium]|nr:hypothetical protein [Mycoplasmatota bacterium]
MNSDKLLSLSTTAYRQGKIKEAYDILINNRDAYIKDTTLYYYSFTLACQLKKVKDAMHFLNEAVITLGMWYNTDFLDSDTNLDLIRDLDDYKYIYKVCKQRQIDLRFSGEKKIDIYVPETLTNKLFLMLPGNFQSIDEVKKSFNQDYIKDYIIAIPQTREFHSYSKYVWGDIKFGLKVVLEHYNEVIKEYDINKNEVILSSFAAGGNVIFKALVENALSASKVIFFAPGISNLESFEPQIKDLKKRNIKILIVCGENDSHYLPISNHFDRLLTKYDVNHKYLILNDLGHSFPINTEEFIRQAIIYFDSSN